MELVPDPFEPFGRALRAFHEGDEDCSLNLRWDPGGDVELPVASYFLRPEEGPPVEQEVLRRLSGSVLDLGAGSGRFAVAAMERGHAVTAVEVLPDAASVLESRGIPMVLADFMSDAYLEPADTVLVLMNGTTHAGTRSGLPRLLERLRALVRPGGRILIDSTDPDHPAVDMDDPGDGRERGELHLQVGFQGVWGAPVAQLFVGPDVLADVAAGQGLACRTVHMDTDGRYLAELRRAPAG